ncbi:trypsin-like peptidase domain-containing protein [Marinibactrum halimedae]|nr:trypsin-like peptidase domain-containing protein [Marinibactrum halimedae]MCD9457535.1 trypsin-like peptidase domain-containing protein [Marinibactrum halimedae]
MLTKKLTEYFLIPALFGLTGAVVIVLLSLDSNTLKSLLLQSNPNEDSISEEQSAPPTTWSGPVSYGQAVKKAAPSVVNIYNLKPTPTRRFPLIDDPLFRHYFNNADQMRQQRLQSTLGSGVIVDNRGYILTNNHVIESAVEIVVLLHDGREALADIIGTDPESDLAVLKINLPALTPIELGNPNSVNIGDVVLAIGNPFGVGQTVTQGIISATGRYGLDLNRYENYIQTDAAINPGNSGGALVDAYGYLVGINTAILDNTENTVGISFAIPSDQAMKVLYNIIENGRVIRGWLGIAAQPISAMLGSAIGLERGNGVVVTELYRGGPAQLAGLLRGDIITHIDDQPVGNGRASMNQIGEKKPGDLVNLSIIRNARQFVVTAQLAEKPLISR